MAWQISPTGIIILKDLEGYRERAYLCEGGRWTLGYGTTRGVKPGMSCTRQQADQWLREDCAKIAWWIEQIVKVEVTQHMVDALILFAYNLGVSALGGSTLLKKLNARDYAGAAAEFPRWRNVRDKKTGRLRVSNGLVNRRRREVELFLTPPLPAERAAQAA